jgi:hypothetical protein
MKGLLMQDNASPRTALKPSKREGYSPLLRIHGKDTQPEAISRCCMASEIQGLTAPRASNSSLGSIAAPSMRRKHD